MKLNNLVIFIICSLLMQQSYAQRFKGAIIGGLSTSQIDGDTQKDYKKPGVYAGVFVETDFNETLGTKIELYFIGKGAIKKIDGFEEFNTSLYYIEMPFLLNIKPIKQFQLDIGLAGSYLIASKLVSLGEKVDEGLYDMHNFDFSGRVSVIYYVKPKLGFTARLDYSLVPVKNNPNWFNSNLSYGVIYKFK